MPTAYGPVTYSEIKDRVARHRAKSRSQATTEACQRLDQMAAELQSAEGSSLAQLGPWKLQCLRVSGFRGIGNHEDDPLLLDFDPTPGITVLCGQNGSGKTSLTDALQTALLMKEPTASTTGVNAPLWQPVSLAQGAQHAKIETRLRAHQGDTIHDLLITVNIAAHTAPEIVLTSRGGERDTTRDCTTAELADLLCGDNPIVAYADIERSLTTQRDLNSHLISLLQLGNRMTNLRDEVARRAAPAKEAEAELRRRWQMTREKLQVVAEQLGQLDPDHAPSVPDAPSTTEDLDSWCPEVPLTATVTPAWEAQCVRMAQEAAASFSRVRQQTGRTIDLTHSRVADLLSQLLEHEAALPDDCPVCGSATDWREAARKSRDGMREAQTAWQSLQRETRAFVDLLRPLAATEPHPNVAHADTQQLLQLSRQAVDVLQAGDVTHKLLLQCDHAASLLVSPNMSNFLTQLADAHVTRTRLNQQWNNALATYREHHLELAPSAREASAWSKTEKLCRQVDEELRSERSCLLETHTAQWVESLLRDAGITLNTIDIKAKTGEIALKAQDTDLTLGMLSAGQRNALLLATMVATHNASPVTAPFGFLILDDPVHAFDDMRINPLAKAIAQIATTRRVIVLTHDERLREHLCALECFTVPTEVRRITRTNGLVKIEPEVDLSLTLVKDARGIIEATDKFEAPNALDEYTNTVRALLRQALDTALTSHALRLDAQCLTENPLMDTLEKAAKTRQRLRKIRGRWQSLGHAVPQALAATELDLLLDELNSGAHHQAGSFLGESPTRQDLLVECRRVEKACKAALAPLTLSNGTVAVTDLVINHA